MLAVVNLSKDDVRKLAEDIEKVAPELAKPEFIEQMPEDHLLRITLDAVALNLADADKIVAAGVTAFHFSRLMGHPTAVCSSDREKLMRLSIALRYLANNIAGLVSFDIKKNPTPQTEKKNGCRG